MTRVLWLTRHGPTAAQIKSLSQAFGQVEIVRRSVTIDTAHDVIRLMRRENCTEVVVVLPPLTLTELVSSGVYPLLSVLNKRRGEHKYFIKIKKIFLEIERLGDGQCQLHEATPC